MVGEQKNKETERLRNNVATANERSASKQFSSSFRALDPSDIAHLQKVYPEIVDELKDSFTRLKTADADWRCVKNEERRLLSCLSSFMPLVSVRSSIFLLRGLNPSLFSLLFEILPIADLWILNNSSNTHFALLRLAFTYAQTHDQFLSSSELLQNGHSVGDNSTQIVSFSPSKSSSSSTDQLTSKYFGQILVKLSSLLNLFELLDARTQSFVISWILKLTSGISDQFRAVKELKEVFTLRSSMLNTFFKLHQFKSSEQRKLFLRCMYKMQTFNLLQQDDQRSRQLRNNFIKLFLLNSSKLNSENFRILWTRTPFTFLIKLFGLIEYNQQRLLINGQHQQLDNFENIEIQQQQNLGQPLMEVFEFKLIANFLFNQKCIGIEIEELTISKDWIQSASELLCENLIQSTKNTKNILSLSSEQSDQQSTSILRRWHFIIGHFALYCIANRMRTPVGGNPLETFTKFENELRTLFASILLRKPQDLSRKQLPQTGPEENWRSDAKTENMEKRVFRSVEDWFRVRMLQYSIECMDKLMCFAIRGSVLEITENLALNSRQFFFVNESSCTDWLTRTTLPLMGVAFANGNFSQIVRLACPIFNEVEKKYLLTGSQIRLDSSTAFVICWLVRSFVELGTPQAIYGVKRWAKKMFFSNELSFEWCKSAALMAEARIEEALEGFLTYHKSQRNQKENKKDDDEESKIGIKSQAHIQRAVGEMALRAASILRNPKISTRISEVFTCQTNLVFIEDDKATKLQKQFYDLQWKRMVALSSWDQLDQSNIDETHHLQKHKFLGWENRGRLIDAEIEALRLFKLRKLRMNGDIYEDDGTNISETLFALQDDLSDSAHFLLLSGTEHTDGLEHSRYALLHAICTGIQHLQKGGQQFVYSRQSMRSPNKQQQNQSGGIPFLLEFDFTELLREWKSETFHRLEIGQMYCSWMERLYGGQQKEHSYLLRKMHRDMAQLAIESGNSQLAAIHSWMATSTSPSQQQQHFNGIDPGVNSINFSAMMPQIMQQQQTFSPAMFSPGFDQQQHYFAPQIPMMQQQQPIENRMISTIPSNATQVLLSEEFDGDYVKLLPTEISTLEQFGIEISSDCGRRFEQLLGVQPIYEEFCKEVQKEFSSSNKENTVSSTEVFLFQLEQPNFKNFWLSIKHRQYRLFELALHSHLLFLENLFPGKSHVQTMEVLLRFLKMLTKQPEWFVRIMNISGGGEMNFWMERISVDVWTVVIPQLFSYLNHSNSIVRSIISLLLDTIGLHLPHAICYQAIVIAEQLDDFDIFMNIKRKQSTIRTLDQDDKEFDGDINSNPINEKDETEELLNDQKIETSLKYQQQTNLVDCCRALVNSLSGSHPHLVGETRTFCNALKRIALLSDEHWLYVLSQFDQQLNRLFRTLASLPAAVQTQQHLKQKQNICSYLEKVHFSLYSLYNKTCVDCDESTQSENDLQFIADFAEQIRESLEILIEQNSVGNYRKAWEPFRKILSDLNKRALKRASLCLNVAKISPVLNEMNSTAVPLPGQEHRPFNEIVTIQKMSPIAYVLPTKTRPKKISFIGNDGKTYTFLFKGQENLYIDARLMQLLRMCNTIFADPKNQRQMDTRPPYHSATYSVTPLGARCGLIQWVEGSIPLFQLYWKWRVRRAKFLAELEENKLNKQQTNPNNAIGGPKRGGLIDISQKQKINLADKSATTTSNEPERPIEHFFNKLRAVFAENDIPKERVADRRRWPPKLVMRVLRDLIDETPRYILAKEIWMHSATSAAWWERTQNFARTTAVASMIGALFGLGDRHLDNVLINLSTGQVVHVDWNVCFGKGKQLRVPEIVEFRLTGNIVNALGPTKTEGIFRLSCERVLEMLRGDKQVISLLLDTFKFDSMLDLGSLLGPSSTRKTHEEMASEVIHRIEQKLLGHELIYNRSGGSSKDVEGINNIMASGMLRL
ncbi:hypothetical protein ACQ4LE_000052, partial [Meloidogyne hapla]